MLLGTNVAAWARNCQVPITFQQLLIGVPQKELVAALAVLKEITGTAIWARMFGAEEVALEHYVPFQLGTVLQASLQMAEAAILTFMEEDPKLDFTENAQGHFGAFFEKDEKNKRGKCGPYAA